MDNLSSIFSGKIPGLNAPVGSIKSSVDQIEKNVISKTLRNPEQVGWGRLNAQKGLNLWGDADKDNVPNILDCSPLDRMEQGLAHKMKNLVSGKGFKEDFEVPLKTNTGELQKYGITQPIHPTQRRVVSTPFVDIEMQRTSIPLGPSFGQRMQQAKGALTDIGVLKTPQQKAEIIKRRKEIQDKQIEFAHQERLKSIEMGRQPTTGVDRIKEEAIRMKQGLQAGSAQFVSGVGSAPGMDNTDVYAQKVQTLIGPQWGKDTSYPTQMASLGSPGQVSAPYAVKVDELLGKGDIAKQWQEQMAQQPQQPVQFAQPQQQQMAQQPQQMTPQGQPQFQPSMQKYSQQSKRSVSYTRGPYRKKYTYPQQPQQQY